MKGQETVDQEEAESLGVAIRESKDIGDVAFVFDSEVKGADHYGNDCDKALFSNIPRDITSWVRQGDMIGGTSQYRRDLLTEHLQIIRPLKEGDASRFHVTAMTGLHSDNVSRIAAALRGYPFFLGIVNLKEAKPLADHFAATLPSRALLQGESCYEPGETLSSGKIIPFDGKFASHGYSVKAIDDTVWSFTIAPYYSGDAGKT